MKFERAIFVDRDGVINVNRADNVRSWEQFVFEHGSLEALVRAAATDFRIIVITNQSGIGRGHLTEQSLQEIHARMVEEIVSLGGRIDVVDYCPHTPEDGCTCRKPSAGMLLRGRDRYALDMAGSYFVGDWVDDVLAARNAGVIPVLVRTGRGERALVQMTENNIPIPRVADNLSSAIDWILGQQTTFPLLENVSKKET